MKAIALIPGTKDVKCIEISEPQVTCVDEVKLKVLEVGICGTDRELVSGERATPPMGEKELILGHEVLGEVVEIGKQVTAFQIGDLAVVTVRRGCGHCLACLNDRPDMCETSGYMERGIKGKHGFQVPYIVDQEKFLVKVPSQLRSLGVLCEPLSIVEKAIKEILTIQMHRLPGWGSPADLEARQALVVGLGPIGLLLCVVLRLRGFKVLGLDIVSSDSLKAKIVQELGGTYIDGKTIVHREIPREYGQIDLIAEAAGVSQLDFRVLEALSNGGGAVFTGVAEPHGAFSVEGGYLMHHLVMKNQVILGSVNAGTTHWKMAVEDLKMALEKWPKTMEKLITSRTSYDHFKEVFLTAPKDEIKSVLTWQ